LNKVRRQRKEVTPTLKTCLIWNKWNVPFSSLTFLHKPAIFSFLARQRSWTCSRKHNVLLLSRKKLTSLQFPAARDSHLKALQTRFHNIFMKKQVLPDYVCRDFEIKSLFQCERIWTRALWTKEHTLACWIKQKPSMITWMKKIVWQNHIRGVITLVEFEVRMNWTVLNLYW
jgi:hypothetical protein